MRQPESASLLSRIEPVQPSPEAAELGVASGVEPLPPTTNTAKTCRRQAKPDRPLAHKYEKSMMDRTSFVNISQSSMSADQVF